MVHFYTSNVDKFLQARLLFDRYGLVLHHWKSKTDPYTEHEELTSRELLTIAIDEVKTSIGSSSLFFIEDTSLRIDALSSGLADFPGLSVKSWFASTSFAELNKLLPPEPASRLATIRSDIALHVPGLDDPLFFSGTVTGQVASSEPTFKENLNCPWLTPTTFNGWFVPNGASRRLGEMGFEESLQFDFRAASLVALITRLEEFAAILNAPKECYAVVAPRSKLPASALLFPPQVSTYVVVGPTCSGKTTFAETAGRILPQMTCIEASSVLRSFMRDLDPDRHDVHRFAHRIMAEKGPDVVAKRVLELYSIGGESDVLITGLRTIEEWLTIVRACPDARLVYVHASPRIRYARFRERARDALTDYESFVRKDTEQWTFGLLRAAADICHLKIANEGSLADYRAQIEQVLSTSDVPQIQGVSAPERPKHLSTAHRLFRCLRILSTSSHPLSCDQIETLTATPWSPGQDSPRGRYSGKLITHNNVNKVLKAAPEMTIRTTGGTQRIQYAIAPAGLAYLESMQMRWPDFIVEGGQSEGQ